MFSDRHFLERHVYAEAFDYYCRELPADEKKELFTAVDKLFSKDYIPPIHLSLLESERRDVYGLN